MEAKIFSPIKSDVHIYIEKEHSMFDSTISSVFNELKVKQLLSKANITKRCGINTTNVVYDLFTVPFLMMLLGPTMLWLISSASIWHPSQM